MTHTYYIVDAFADRLFGGNPAAVMPLDAFLPDAVMQSIAAENNLSETAFVVPDGEPFRLRWFTPTTEVDLCGHATLAAASVLAERGVPEPWVFETRSGTLTVTRTDGRFVLDLPGRLSVPTEAPAGLAEALGVAPVETHLAQDWICVFDSAATVAALRPDYAAVARFGPRNVIATAAGGEGVDVMSRYFAPAVGIPEDPVTGSAHAQLVPFWAARLGRKALVCRQASARGGNLWCEVEGDRVRMAGHAVPYAKGEIFLP
jgi:PhzF family phenazine biosynthesis protein